MRQFAKCYSVKLGQALAWCCISLASQDRCQGGMQGLEELRSPVRSNSAARPGRNAPKPWFLLAYEETGVDFCTPVGGVASRSAARYVVECTTVGRCGRPVHTDRNPADWREEMTATFCNVTTGPNTSGYGSRGVSTSSGATASSGVSASSGSAGSVSPSILPCSSEPPFNELCN